MTPRLIAGPDVSPGAEMNHRIANNLALISALIDLDSRSVRDAEAASVLAATQRRIHAVADVHRRLYRDPEIGLVNLGAILRDIVDSLRVLISDRENGRTITVRADDFALPNEHAAAFAILVSELVGNACKHAYEIGEAGEVRVVFSGAQTGDWSIAVEDDGIGIGHREGGAAGLGSHIIQAVSHQLRGTYRWEPGSPGTRFVMWGRRPALVSPQRIVLTPKRQIVEGGH